MIDSYFESVPKAKRSCLDFLVADLDILSQEYPDHWGITLHSECVRLNAGRVECTVLDSERIRLLVLNRRIPRQIQRGAQYKHAPGCIMVHIPFTDAKAELPRFFQSHRAALKLVARHETTPSIRNAHSPGVIAYLSEWGKRSLAQPGYIARSAVNYWIVKGQPSENDWAQTLVPGNARNWYTARPAKGLTRLDRVFCWSSSPDLQVVGVGEVVKPDAGNDDFGNRLFRIRYLSHKLLAAPGIEELRRVRGLEDAAFLKPGPATTILSLSREEGETLYSVLCEQNPGLETIWPDLRFEVPVDPSDEDFSINEGNRRVVHHLRLERNRTIIEKKKRLARNQLQCCACGFDFEKVYGARGKNFCEVHHVIPLSQNEGHIETRLEDLCIICSNCHRMLHRSPWITVDELKYVLGQSKPGRRLVG